MSAGDQDYNSRPLVGSIVFATSGGASPFGSPAFQMELEIIKKRNAELEAENAGLRDTITCAINHCITDATTDRVLRILTDVFKSLPDSESSPEPNGPKSAPGA